MLAGKRVTQRFEKKKLSQNILTLPIAVSFLDPMCSSAAKNHWAALDCCPVLAGSCSQYLIPYSTQYHSVSICQGRNFAVFLKLFIVVLVRLPIMIYYALNADVESCDCNIVFQMCLPWPPTSGPKLLVQLLPINTPSAWGPRANGIESNFPLELFHILTQS